MKKLMQEPRRSKDEASIMCPPSSLAFTLCLCAFAALCLFYPGCKAEKSDSEPKELLLYCGAGIRPPAQEIVEAFEREHGVKIVTDYAGSEVLISKIKLARRGDFYMPGDKHYVDQAAQEGMILSQKSVCYFVPTILVQKGSPKNIRGLQDLLNAGLKLGLGDAKACAIGRKTKKIFAKNDIAWENIEKNLVFQSLTVNELGMQIQADSLDAVVVWDAIAKYYSEHGTEVAIPVERNVISTVDIGVLKFTQDRELAERFVEFAVSSRGRDIFRKHNYTIDPPE
ncbi:MAG: molybdate ABC transporter substrate-binding protein [Planctomycetota bacterium]|nr:molybdate ABC transporter substrate-binding protein [Planctomycetota bacterium]